MKKSKILALVLAFVFAVSMLAACGKKDEGDKAGSTKTATSTTTAALTQPAQEEFKQAELIYYTNGNGQPADTALVEEAMNKILTEKIKATIKMNFIPWAEYPDKMNVISAAGGSFDLCFSAGWRNYSAMAAKGAYADLTELLPKYAAGYLAEMPAYVIDAAKVAGKQFGAPILQGLAAVNKLFVTSEIFDKYKLPASITKLDDLDTYMDAIKKGEPGMTPLYAYTANGVCAPFSYYMLAAPLASRLYLISDSPGWYGADFKVVNQYDTDRAKEYYQWARNAYLNGWIAKNAATQKDDSANLFKAKKFAMIFAGSAPQFDASNWSTYSPVTFKAIDLGAVAAVGTGNCISQMYSVSAKSTKKEQAVAFINLINTDKALYNTMCYGIEGKHYVLKNGFYALPEGVTAEKVGYNPGTNWVFGYTYNAYLPEGADPKINQLQLDFDKAATPEPALGFAFDSEPVKTQITNVQSVLEEYAPALESGVVDPTTGLANMLEKLKAAGVDEVIAEKQKQLDAWRAANGK